MTQEEKQLLLKDLCGRLPYGIKFYVDNTIPPIPSEADYRAGRVYYTLTATGIDIYNDCIFTEETGMDCVLFVNRHGKEIQLLKPYLRPMLSMTEEEKDNLQSLHNIISDENYGDGYSPRAWDAITEWEDYCNARHLDYRGLIQKGLALEAPEEIYKSEKGGLI